MQNMRRSEDMALLMRLALCRLPYFIHTRIWHQQIAVITQFDQRPQAGGGDMCLRASAAKSGLCNLVPDMRAG